MKKILKKVSMHLLGGTKGKPQLEPNGIRDLRAECNDPRQLVYLHEKRVIADVAIKDGRRNGFPLGCGVDPFEAAVAEAWKNGESGHTIEKILGMYYSSVQPKNASEWLGLESGESAILENAPPWGRVLPWQTYSVDERVRSVEAATRKQNRREGISLAISDGYAHFGPVSKKKLKMEAKRLWRTARSIKEKGYQRHDGHDGDILATVLVSDDGSWKWLAETGQHRVGVLAGLGFDRIPDRFHRSVYRVDASIWPNVLSGVFSEKDALETFDRIFYASPSDIRAPWLKLLNTSIST